MRAKIILALLFTLALAALVSAQGEWYDGCPPDVATYTPWPEQPTYTPRPTYTPESTPTCRPTIGPGGEQATPTPYPTATLYPTGTPYPTQPAGTGYPTQTPTPGVTSTPTLTPTHTPTHTPTLTPTPTSTPTAGDTYYVSPGNDLSVVVAMLSPGDTLVLRDGVYHSSMLVGVAGTATLPITIRAEHDGRAFVDGQSSRRPCQISSSSWVRVEGIVCHHSPDMVFNVANSDHVYLSRVSAYQAGPDYGDHIFEIYRSENVTLEDCAATGRGRNTYIAFESDFVTFRRCWGRYVTNGTQQGADWMQIYGSADCLIENCVGTREPSDIRVDVNQYWYASTNRAEDCVDRNRMVGCVAYGHDYHGLNVISANQQLHGNGVENSVFIGNDTSMGYGVPYSGIFQRCDDDFTMDRLTLVNHQGAVRMSHDSSNPWFDIVGRLTNSSIVAADVGIGIASYSEINVALDHHHNNFYDVESPFVGTFQGVGETFVDPGYDVERYGLGAYLFVPPTLQGQGENGSDIGAEVLYRSIDGTLTDEPLWPWPMEARICAETAHLFRDGVNGFSVTYESHQVEYDYDGDGQAETYNCAGGIWKTLDGVY